MKKLPQKYYDEMRESWDRPRRHSTNDYLKVLWAIVGTALAILMVLWMVRS